MPNTFRGLIKTLRPPVGIVSFAIAASAAFFALYEEQGIRPDLARLIWALLATWLGTVASYAVNDYFDADVDRRSLPDRAIPSGDLKAVHVLALGIVLGVASMLICILVFNWMFMALGLLGVVAVALYSGYGKRKTPYSFLLVVVATGLMPLAVWVAFAPLSLSPFLIALTYLFFEPGFTLAGVCRDMEGDRDRGMPTLPVRLGLPTSGWVILACWIAVPLTILALYVYTALGTVFLVGSLGTSAWLLSLGGRLVRRPRATVAGKVFLGATLFFWGFNLSIVADILLRTRG